MLVSPDEDPCLVDNDEDKKQNLSGVTKAKRKGIEKRLEGDRRLASLQKSREMKADGIDVRKRKRLGWLGFNGEIPSVKKQPDVVLEIRPVEQPKFPTTSVEPEIVQAFIKADDHKGVWKRSKTMLPPPQISDHELKTVRDELCIKEGKHVHCTELKSSNSCVVLNSLREAKNEYEVRLKPEEMIVEDTSKWLACEGTEEEGMISYTGSGSTSSQSGVFSAGSSTQFSFLDVAINCKNSPEEWKSLKSKPGSTAITVPGIKLPPSLPQVEFRLSITFAKTYNCAYGINPDCIRSVSRSGYYLHYFLVDPEPKQPVKASYNSQIPPPGSFLDRLMKQVWFSLYEANQCIWRRGRWGDAVNAPNGHGFKNPTFDQENYFRNACLVYQFVDLKSKIEDCRLKLGREVQVVEHYGLHWRQVNIKTFSTELKSTLGFAPRLDFRVIQGKLCLYEVVFRLSHSLQLLNFEGDSWKGQNCPTSEEVDMLF